MGVKGLWQLLECVGRPVTLESLEHKVLGVDLNRKKDASLILNQAVKGLRDKHGNPVRNAHLVGLFNRVCKLLYYRIKPVFVFDGGVPHLKKKTLAARKERRFKAIHGSNKAAEKIVKNYLKAKALETVTGRKSTTTVRSKSPREPDVFELPPLPSIATSADKSSSEDEDTPILDQFRSQQSEETYQDPAAINVDSEDFKSLPAEIQHELIKEIKEERKWMNKTHMPGQASDFSSFQLEGVLKRGKMNQRLDELCKEMNSRNSGELAGVAPNDSLGEHTAVKSQKILSEDSAHYILLKNNGQATEDEKGEPSKDFSGEGGFFREGEDCEIVSWTNPQPKPAAAAKAPSFDIPELCSSDSEVLSPLVDVAEAGGSPTSPQAKKNAFSFSPVKEKKTFEKVLINLGDVEKPQRGQLQSHGSQTEVEKGDSEGFKVRRHQKQQEHMLDGISAKEKNEDDSLLTEIMNKKQELDNLIKKWEDSKKKKTVIDLTSSAHYGNDKYVEDKELPCLRSESLQDTRLLEKEQDGNTEERGDIESVVLTEDEKVTQEKPVHTVCVSESDSERSSVEEITASVRSRESDIIEESSTYRSPLGEDSCDARGTQSEAMENIQVEPLALTDNHNMERVERGDAEFKSVSPDVVMEITPSVDGAAVADQEDIHPSQDGNQIPVVETQDSLEESRVGTAVDEQEAGPSGLPVEWQGATVEGLEEIQMDIETEQQSLATEQARQNRIAASVSTEMFAECQELLQLFGVPYLVSPMEAEAQCAALDVLGLTEGSITDDSDIFLFGGTRVYKNIFNQQKHAELYSRDAVQRNLALNRSDLIRFAFITGSDYTEGIQGVGPVGAMEIVHEFSGEDLEGLKKFKIWHDEAQNQTKIPQETKVKRKMRSVVLPMGFPSEEVYEAYSHPVVDESTEQFEWGKPDLHSLRLFASDKLGWSSTRTDELLLPVMKQLNRDETQLKISQFFQVKFQETRHVKSKRIRRVVNRKLNPPSGSDSDHGGDKNQKENNSADNAPNKTTKHGQVRNKKRSHSMEINPKGSEENESHVTRPKRAKEENTESGARSSTVNRRGSYRGRGRGRTKLRKNESGVHSTSDLKLSFEITPLKLPTEENSQHVSRENRRESSRNGRSQRVLGQPSTCAEDKRDGLIDSVCMNNAKTDNKQSNSAVRSENRVEKDNSTSDSTDSGDDENVYTGPKPVSVFNRGRGRGKGTGRGKGKEGRKLAEQKTYASDSTDNEDEEDSVHVGSEPGLVFRQGRGRGKGNRRGRGKERMAVAQKETSTSDGTDNEDNGESVCMEPKSVSVSHRGKARGRGRGRGRLRGRGKGTSKMR